MSATVLDRRAFETRGQIVGLLRRGAAALDDRAEHLPEERNEVRMRATGRRLARAIGCRAAAGADEEIFMRNSGRAQHDAVDIAS